MRDLDARCGRGRGGRHYGGPAGVRGKVPAMSCRAGNNATLLACDPAAGRFPSRHRMA